MYGPGGGRWKVRVGGDDGTFDAKYLKYSTVRYIIVRYSIVQYSTVLYSTLQYNTVYIGPYWPAPPTIHRGLEWPQYLNSLSVLCLSVCLFSVCGQIF